MRSLRQHPRLGTIAEAAQSPTVTRVLRRLWELGAVDLSDDEWGGRWLTESAEAVAHGRSEADHVDAVLGRLDLSASELSPTRIEENVRRQYRAASRALESPQWADVRYIVGQFRVRSVRVLQRAHQLLDPESLPHART